LALNGPGLRKATMFKVNVYVAALYVAKPSTGPASGSGLEMQHAAETKRRISRPDPLVT